MQEFFWSQSEGDLKDAIENFRSSVAAYKDKGPLPVHPIFGKATKEQVAEGTSRQNNPEPRHHASELCAACV